jgi:hypothetical protein
MNVITNQSDFMCATDVDATEAKRRAEWLHIHKAPKDWIILSMSEVSVIRAELLALERERDEARESRNKWEKAAFDLYALCEERRGK